MYRSKGYAKARYHARLIFLEQERPVMYEAIKKNGAVHCTFFEEEAIAQFEADGYEVWEADIDKEIEYLRKRLSDLEKPEG